MQLSLAGLVRPLAHFTSGTQRSRSCKGESSAMYSRSHESEYTNGYYAGTDPAEHCELPPAYDYCSSSSCDSRSQLAFYDRHAAAIGSVSGPHTSSWEIAPEVETSGAPAPSSHHLSQIVLTTVYPCLECRCVTSGPGTNETILARLDRQAVDVGQWAADTSRHMEGVSRRRDACNRRSTQSDLSEQSESSPGPPTPHSSPQSSPPSADFSTSPAFLKRLDDALKGLHVTLPG